jgi:hypothetical protein
MFYPFEQKPRLLLHNVDCLRIIAYELNTQLGDYCDVSHQQSLAHALIGYQGACEIVKAQAAFTLTY